MINKRLRCKSFIVFLLVGRDDCVSLIYSVIQERALAGFDFDVGKCFSFDNTPVGVECFEGDGVCAGWQFEAADLNIVGQ